MSAIQTTKSMLIDSPERIMRVSCPECGRQRGAVIVLVMQSVVVPPIYSVNPCGSCKRKSAQQKMHPTLGESSASDSESNPAPKRVI